MDRYDPRSSIMETYLANHRRLASYLATNSLTVPTPAPLPPSGSAADKHPLWGPIPPHLLYKYMCPTPSNSNPNPINDSRCHVPLTPPPPASSAERRPRVPLPSLSFHQLISSIPPLSNLNGTHMTPPPPRPLDQPSRPHPSSSNNDDDYPLRGPIPADPLHKFLCPISNNNDNNRQTPVVNAEALKNDPYAFIFKACERKQHQKAQFFATIQSQNDNVTNIHIESIEDERPPTNVMDVEPPIVNENVSRNIDRDIIIIEDEDEDELPPHDQEMAAASSAVGFSGRKGGVVDDCNTSICVLLTEDEPQSLEELSEWSSSYERLVNQNVNRNFDGGECAGTSTFHGLGEGALGSISNLKRSADLVDIGSPSKTKRCLESSPLEVDQCGLSSNSKRKEVVCSLSRESGSRRRNYGMGTDCGNLEYSSREMSSITLNESQLMLSRLKSSATLTGFFADVAPYFTKFRAMNWGICFGAETELPSDAISKERLIDQKKMRSELESLE